MPPGAQMHRIFPIYVLWNCAQSSGHGIGALWKTTLAMKERAKSAGLLTPVPSSTSHLAC